MTRRGMSIGVAAWVISALLLVGAAPASAANFTTTEYPATFEAGPGQITAHKIKINEALTIECASIKFSGELAKASNELTVFPEYSGCTPILGTPVTFTIGCDFGLVANSETEGSLNIKCKEGAAIVIDVGTICSFKVAAQGPLKKLTYKNLGGTAGIEVTTNLENIAYTRTGSALCGAASGFATYTGTSIYTAKNKETSLRIPFDVG